MLSKANEPLYIVRELRKLGELELMAETDTLPHLHEIEPDRPYIGWTGTLRTAATRAQVEEVFEFVTGDCEMEIVEADPAPASEGSAATCRRVLFPARRLPGTGGRGRHAGSGAAVRRKSRRCRHPARGRKLRKRPARQNRLRPKRLPPRPGSNSSSIDRVVNMVGELVIAQAMLGQIVHDLPEAT